MKELSGSDGQNNECKKDFLSMTRQVKAGKTETKSGEEHKASAAPVTHSYVQLLAKKRGSHVAALLVLKRQC